MDIVNKIIKQLNEIEYIEDLSDIGNEIGIVIGEIIEDNKDKIGYELNDFIHGLKHGVSLIDGTH